MSNHNKSTISLDQLSEVLTKKDDNTEALAAMQPEVKPQKVAVVDRVEKGPKNPVDTMLQNLEKYATERVGSDERAFALKRVIDVAVKNPKKAVLDEVVKFFITNKNEEFLGPLQALQNTCVLESNDNIKARVFYELFRSISLGTATRATISLNMVRTIFGDEFTSYISTKLRR